MTDLQKLLSSVSPEDLDQIKGVAQSLLSNESNSIEQKQDSTSQSIISTENLKPIMAAISKMNDNDDRIKLILHLKPLLSNDRQKRADDAVRFLHIMQILPEIRGLL